MKQLTIALAEIVDQARKFRTKIRKEIENANLQGNTSLSHQLFSLSFLFIQDIISFLCEEKSFFDSFVALSG